MTKEILNSSPQVSEEGQADPPTTADGGRSDREPHLGARTRGSQVPRPGDHRGAPLCLPERQGEGDRDPEVGQRRELEGAHS